MKHFGDVVVEMTRHLAKATCRKETLKPVALELRGGHNGQSRFSSIL